MKSRKIQILLILVIFIFQLIFIKTYYPLAIELRCQRKIQVMNDNFKVTMADAALKIDTLEDKNNAKLLGDMYRKCIEYFK